MGRRPEPTALKVAKGTFRPDRAKNGGDEPNPSILNRTPAPPRSLGDVGRRKWRATAKLLMGIGVLTAADLDALESYCAAWDELRECEAVVAADGAYYTTDKGYVGQHPAVNRSFKARDVIRRFMLEFGMTPASRTGVKTSKPSAAPVMQRKRG